MVLRLLSSAAWATVLLVALLITDDVLADYASVTYVAADTGVAGTSTLCTLPNQPYLSAAATPLLKATTSPELAIEPQSPTTPAPLPSSKPKKLATKVATTTQAVVATTAHRNPTAVPFYSQFRDITEPSWQKVSCGIASLAMLISYNGQSVNVETLLHQGIDAHAYLSSDGWTYAGLIGLAQRYGLNGRTHILYSYSLDDAFADLAKTVSKHPVMASVHYRLEPTNPIPHLIVVNAIKDGRVYYNDPANSSGNSSVSEQTFKAAWKKRYIEISKNS